MVPKKKPFTVVVGLGVTGVSCVRYLVQQGVPVAVTDSRVDPPGLAAFKQVFPDVPLALGAFSLPLLEAASEIIVSPGVSLQEPAIAKMQRAGKSIIGDIELFARQNDRPVVAITGSNGKTTVTTLLGLMVKEAGRSVVVCGNIGEPVLQSLAAPRPDCYVMELSSFQLETTFSLRPLTGAVLNVSPDHLDRYVDYQAYVAAKQRIYLNCEHPVVNQDEPALWESLGILPALSFSVEDNGQADFYVKQDEGEINLMQRDQVLLASRELKLQGRHHWQNALAALALGQALALPMSAMLKVLREFSGLKHRCQWVADFQGVAWYNDSKATNVGAALAAVNSLGEQIAGKVVLIAGGVAKGATEEDFSMLRQPLRNHVSHLVLMGQDADLIESVLQDSAPIRRVASMEEAVSVAGSLAGLGDVVLLSPACASFDMFDHFEQRGDVFIEAVAALCA